MAAGIFYGIICIGYFVLGIYQLAAIVAGIEYWLELPWIISIFIAFFITYIPLVGTAMGVLGAVTAWGWSWQGAIGLYAGPMITIGIIALIFPAYEKVAKSKSLISWMHIANAVLALLASLGVAIHILQSLTESSQTKGSAYILGQVMAGVLLWIAPFYLAWRGLAPGSTVSQVRKARRTNIFAAGVYTLIFLGMLVSMSGEIRSIVDVIPFLLVVGLLEIPYVLNTITLGRRKLQLEETQTAESVESHALPDITSTTTTSTAIPPSRRQSNSNYFVRHWRGELSLGISYWLNGGVFTSLAVVILTAAVEVMVKDGYTLRTISLASLSILLFSVIAGLWSLVGIWRSANHHVARGGKAGWASAARIGVVFGTLAMTGQLFATIIPQVKELALIASGNDPIGTISIKIAVNGQSAIINGMFGEGSAAEVERILDAAPGVTSLVLNSAGGRLHEAKRLASVVQSRALNTYVEGQCASACTYVFLAGRDRAATPNAQIGFHRPSFPGLDADAQQAMTRGMLDVYRAANLPEMFIQRIAKTPPEGMWYPTRDELIAAHVITRVSLGGEAAIAGLTMRSKQELLLNLRNNPLFDAIEKRFPGTAQKAVETAWAAKERGGSDADVQTAIRGVIVGIYPELLKTTDVPTLESYVNLMISQMSAAHAISGEACAKLLAGKLDITKTLPPNIAEQEKQLLWQALKSSPTTVPTPPDPALFSEIIQKATVNLPEGYVDVVADQNAYANQPDLICEATRAFFGSINALPSHERDIALRGLFQGEN